MNTKYVVYRRTVGFAHDVGRDPPYTLLRRAPTVLASAPAQLIHDRNGFRKNWLYHLPAILLRLGKTYVVYMLLRGEDPVCQCILTPASKRFPFMAPEDWQFGLVHTAPPFRRQGLARIMLSEILREQASGNSYWWLTEIDNVASRRLAESVSFVAFGDATRKKSRTGIPYFEMGVPRTTKPQSEARGISYNHSSERA